MKIREATHADADEGARVLRRSIAELCRADHNDDQAIVLAWNANKTPETWKLWVNQETTELYVAVEENGIVGVGMLDRAGTIMLNYVSPDHRWRGVSKALLAHMEREAFNRGLRQCVLESTQTARSFYESAGYHSSGDGVTMIKTLNV